MNMQELKEALVGLLNSGKAARIRTVVVSPEIWAQLEGEDGFHGKIGVRGQKGNVFVHFNFDVLKTNFGSWAPTQGFFFVPHSAEDYKRLYLGREPEFLGDAGANKCRENYQLREVNPISGVIRRKYRSGSKWIHDITWEDVVAHLDSGGDEGDLRRLVLNPPEIRWMGSLETYLNKHDPVAAMRSCTVFTDACKQKPELGHLYITKDGCQPMVAVQAKDGYGNVRRFVIINPCDPKAFINEAGRYFPAEEIWLALKLQGIRLKLDDIKAAIPTPNWINVDVDHEWTGRIDDRLSEPFVHALDSYGIQYAFPIDGEMDDYFHADWTGWPETAAERLFNAMADAFAHGDHNDD